MKRVLLLAGAVLMAACEDPGPSEAVNRVVLANHSATPVFLKGLPSGVQAFSLIGSDDNLAASPGYVFGGSADGAGVLANVDGTYTIVVNHEDNFSVSRVQLDATFKPVSAQYILTSDAGRWRLCSATLATPEIHGFGPLFITVGESSAESQIHGVNPNGAPNSSRILEALGRWNSENAVPLPRTAYANRTVIVVGDDDSGAQGGQLALYVSNTVGDLDNGNLYVLSRQDGNMHERDMVVGQTYPVVFKQIANQKTMTGLQINTRSVELQAMAFGRTEDIDYRKGVGGGREIYFNVTGQNNTGVNADNSRSKYGRVYKLVLDASDPLRGTLEVILDGDDRTGPAGRFQNPDNILVTSNYAYIKEDPNGYGDETHDSFIYQYNLTTRQVTVVAELDHRRGDPKYNVGGDSRFGSWEYGAMLDISDVIRIPDTFLLAIQPHTWTGDRYRGVDGGTLRATENQASLLVVLRGLPR